MDVPEIKLGVDVVLDSLSAANSPQCAHGPTIQFERYIEGSVKRFYACSASRDRRDCSFYQWAGHLLSNKKAKQRHKLMKQQQKSPFSSQEYQKRLKEFRRLPKKKRLFCRQCGVLHLPSDVNDHEGHVIKAKIAKTRLRRPTQLLTPIDNNKTNAQYLFSSDTLKFMLKTMEHLGFHKVLCVGVPRVHEEICVQQVQKKTKIQTLLLDIDQRMEQFYSKKKYCRYNMFNHHFFRGAKSEAVYREFLTDSAEDSTSGGLLVIMDPPFGGLVDVLAHTMKCINNDWKQANPGTDRFVPFMWVFPYFMESRITPSLPSVSMLDYKVDYDNHTVYNSERKSKKHGSPVRIFTNLPASEIILSGPQYRLCKKCERYVSVENKHCEQCNACTSKDGRQYVHCLQCERCVKPNWSHCTKCSMCHLPDYKCQMPSIGCHICGDHSHKRRECPKKYDKQFRQKRKHQSKVSDVETKKRKTKA